MTSFRTIYKKLILTDAVCWFFIKVVELSVFCFVMFFVYCFVMNSRNYVHISNDVDTTITKPVVKTLDKGDNYTVFSEKGVFVREGFYKFEDVKIVNENINIFAKELDFYSNNNETILKNRPVIIINNDR